LDSTRHERLMYLGHIDWEAEGSANPRERLVTEPALVRVYGGTNSIPESTGKTARV